MGVYRAENNYLIKLPRTELAALENLHWKELLAYTKKNYPQAYLEGLDEVCPLQLGHQEVVFTFAYPNISRGGPEAKNFWALLRPLFRREETRRHFTSLPLYVMGMHGFKGLIGFYQQLIAENYRQLLEVEQEEAEQDSAPAIYSRWEIKHRRCQPQPTLHRRQAASDLDKRKQAWNEYISAVLESWENEEDDLMHFWPNKNHYAGRGLERVFSLVRVFKQVDWEQETILYTYW